MADPSRPGDPGPGREPGLGTPRWVKVFLIIAAALAVAFIVSLLAGVGHGPGLHMAPVEHGP